MIDGVTAGDGKRSDTFCIDHLSEHPGMVHSIVFAAQAFHDLTLGVPTGSVASFHLAKTFQHLQLSINDQQQAKKDTTMSIVVMLATAAILTGDFATALKHRDGLLGLLNLRGGLDSVSQGSLLEHKIQT